MTTRTSQEMLEPELTSVSTDYEILGEMIVDTMIDMIEKKKRKIFMMFR